MKFIVMESFFLNISPRTWNLQSRQNSKSKSTNLLIFLLTEKYIFGGNCLIRSKTAVLENILRLNWMIFFKKVILKWIYMGFLGNIRWIT